MQFRFYFVTSNNKKYEEAKKIIPYLEKHEMEIEEIRSDDFEMIAFNKLLYVLNRIGKSNAVIVEDSGIKIKALNDFPGTYSSFAFKGIGLEGVLNLTKNLEDKSAVMVSYVACYIPGYGIITAKGEVEGSIADSIRGKEGMAYDKIFIPKGYNVTFSEDMSLKSEISHRVKAFKNIKEKIERIKI